jgi:hypothetical protein
MRIDLNTTNFDKVLTSGDINAQTAFETLDEKTVTLATNQTITGTKTISDNVPVQFGTGLDASCYSSGDNLYIDCNTSDKDLIFRINDGGVVKTILTFDGSANQLLVGTGTQIQFASETGDKINFFSDTYKIGITTGTIYYITDTDTVHRFQVASAIINYIDNTGIRIQDTYKLQVGSGNDGQFYSSSDDVYVDNVTQDKDIIFRINDGSVTAELLRLNADVSRVEIRDNNSAYENQLWINSSTQAAGATTGLFIGKNAADCGTNAYHGANMAHIINGSNAALWLGVNASSQIKIESTLVTLSVTIKAAGYQSSDGTAGWTGTFTSGSGATVTVKNGLITGVV